MWEINRGLWKLGDKVDRERFATLSFDGRVQVVAEIDGRTRHDVNGVTKWALTGRVLRPGDPVHDALKGAAPPRHRNPVGYFDTATLDSMPASQRAVLQLRDSATMVVTWNPKRWNPDNWAEEIYPSNVEAVETGRLLRDRWSTGNRKTGIEPGDRVFFLRQGVEPRGVVGSGTAASRIFPDEQWDDDRAGEDANYVLIDWNTLLLPDDGLPHSHLIEAIPEGGSWAPQASGWVLPPAAATKLETLWAQHLGQPAPLPHRGSSRQRWQMDPARRRTVEDAAQERLMAHYRDLGWTSTTSGTATPTTPQPPKTAAPSGSKPKAPKPAAPPSSSPAAKCNGPANTPATASSASSPTSPSCPTAKSILPPERSGSSNGAQTTATSPPATSTTHLLTSIARTDPGTLAGRATTTSCAFKGDHRTSVRVTDVS